MQGLANGLNACYSDDRIIGHHTWNYLLAWRDYIPQRSPIKPLPKGRFWLREGGIIIERRDDTELYLALNKGGVFKLFRNGKLIASDTQFSLLVREGSKLKNAVGHLIGNYQIDVEDNEITISGFLGWAKQKQMNPFNLIALRLVMLTVGRFFPNLIRTILQKILITGKKPTPYKFLRRLSWQNGHWRVDDELSADSWTPVQSVDIGVDRTSIYVVMSRTFQPGQLQPSWDLTAKVKQLTDGESLRLTRVFE